MKKGLTLAEILITLGIIGVVAAMTIPGLVTKYRANKLRTQLQKANAIIQQATMRMKADELNIDEIISKGDYQTIHSYFKNGGCKIPTSAANANYKNYLGKFPTTHAADSKLLSPYCLFDGMVLWIGQINIPHHSLLAIDINGWKNKPDRYGQDVFFWVYNPDTQTLVPLGENDYIKNGFKTYYSKCPGAETAEMGIGCTYKALNDKSYFEKLPK